MHMPSSGYSANLFSHIISGCFNGTRIIEQLPQWQWSNGESITDRFLNSRIHTTLPCMAGMGVCCELNISQTFYFFVLYTTPGWIEQCYVSCNVKHLTTRCPLRSVTCVQIVYAANYFKYNTVYFNWSVYHYTYTQYKIYSDLLAWV